nr:hypothetical protein [uncultured Solibaculum sp.]
MDIKNKNVLAAALLICFLCSFFTGCAGDNLSSSEGGLGLHLTSDPAEKVVMFTVDRMVNWAVDYSDMEVLVGDSDLIVIATVESIDKTIARSGFYSTFATIHISETLKGESSTDLSIVSMGGYVNYEEYVKGLQEGDLAKQDLDWTEKEKQNGVVKAQVDEQNLLQEEEQYILCLRKSEEVGYVTVGSYHGIMRIDGEKVWRKENAGLFDKEDIIQSILEAQEP